MKMCDGFAPIKAGSINSSSSIRCMDPFSKTSLDAAAADEFPGSFPNPIAEMLAARSKTSMKVIEPNYNLAYLFGIVGLVIILANPGDSCSVSTSACLPSLYGVLAGGLHIFIGSFFGYQTRKIRCVFDDSSFELKRFDLAPHDSLKSQGENLFLGGPNRWKYDAFVNWEFFPSKDFPILVYFKETQTPKHMWKSPFGLDKVGGGQVHFFPAFANVSQLAEEFEYRGCRKSATHVVVTNKLLVDFQFTLDESFQSVNEDEKNVSNTTLQNITNIYAIIESVDESKEKIRENGSLKDYAKNQRSKFRMDTLVPFYRKVYDNFQKIRGKTINYDEYFTNDSSNRISLATYGPNILQNGCNITVQIMDPRISTSHRGAPAFFTLESVGAFIPDACVVITTSKCKIHLHNKDNTQMPVDDVLYHHIYNSSLPLFQAMIKRGQVRVKILDHTMYNLKRCDNFYSPSAAIMNVNYWTDLFIDGVDSDMVLIMQDDSVLCNEPNFEYLRRYPYIGALWLEYECNLIKKLWKDFTQVPLKEYRDKERSGLLSDRDRRSDLENVTSTIDSYCDKIHGIGAVGNGGFSLRSRKAMLRVINTCPHVLWSGIDLVNRTFPCLVEGELAEDLYFATVLRGLNAPIPTAYEAAVFSVERVWPSEVTNRFGGPKTYNELVQTTRNVMKRVNFAHVNGRIETVPLGFHQAHYFNPKSVTLEGDLAAFCPHNPFVLDPLEKRNKKS